MGRSVFGGIGAAKFAFVCQDAPIQHGNQLVEVFQETLIATLVEVLRFEQEPQPIARFVCLLQCDGKFCDEISKALRTRCFCMICADAGAAAKDLPRQYKSPKILIQEFGKSYDADCERPTFRLQGTFFIALAWRQKLYPFDFRGATERKP